MPRAIMHNYAKPRGKKPNVSLMDSNGKTYRASWKEIAPRKSKSANQARSTPVPSSSSNNPPEPFEFPEMPSFSDGLYYQKKRRPTTAERKAYRNQRWHQSKNHLLASMRQYLYQTPPSRCQFGQCTNDAMSWCYQCSDIGPLCNECSIIIHQSIRSQTHITRSLRNVQGTMIWESTNVPPWGDTIRVPCRHGASLVRQRKIKLIQSHGQRQIILKTCDCCSWNQSLLEVGYWGTSPKQPSNEIILQYRSMLIYRTGSAIDMDVMINFRQLKQGCGINAYTYSNMLKRTSTSQHVIEEAEIYRPLYDTYKIFSFLYGRCEAFSSDLSSSIQTKCAPCHHNSDKVHFAAIDACFGAVGKLHQNQYPTVPFYNHDYMLADLPKEYVMQHSTTEEENLESNDSKRGCQRRSTRGPLQKSGYYDGLNETGICGSVCKHGVPLYSINVRFGGEKMVFPSTLLDRIHEGRENHQLVLLFDSMCAFNLYRQNRSLFVPQTCGLSAGHSLTHSESCQVEFDPTRVLYNGLFSGEEIESHWAKLMHMWLPLREASSSNRHDELSEQLHFISEECNRMMGIKLRKQYYKARKTLSEHQRLVELYREKSGSSDDEVTLWYRQYRLLKASREANLQLDFLEQKRLNLVDANEDNQYWISLMRTHDHHNYKTRSGMSKFVTESSRARAEALEEYNDIRTDRYRGTPRLSLESCRARGILNREYFETEDSCNWKYKQYDSLQVIARAREELSYTKSEIKGLFLYGNERIRSFETLHADHVASHQVDRSIAQMLAVAIARSKQQLVIWTSHLKQVSNFLNLDMEAAPQQFSDDSSYPEDEQYDGDVFCIPKEDPMAIDWKSDSEDQ